METTEAYEIAGKLLTAVLEGEVNHWDIFGASNDADSRAAYKAVDKLVDTKKDIVQRAASIKREIDSAVEFASGRRGSMNSLGVLQSDGLRFDMDCALFHDRFDVARDQLVRLILGGQIIQLLEGWRPYNEDPNDPERVAQAAKEGGAISPHSA